MRTSRRPAAAIRCALGLAVIATVASGCSYASPAVITTPYAASDGTNAELGPVKFRNFLLVAAEKGKPGVVAGAVAVDGPDPVTVRLTVLQASGGAPLAQADVKVEPGVLASVGVGEDAVRLQLPEVPVQPGAILTIHAQTPAGGKEFPLPVVPLSNEYATLTPTAGSTSAPAGSSSSSAPSSSAAASSASTTDAGSPTGSPASPSGAPTSASRGTSSS